MNYNKNLSILIKSKCQYSSVFHQVLNMTNYFIKLIHQRKNHNLFKHFVNHNNYGTHQVNNNKVIFLKIIFLGLLKLRKSLSLIRFIIANESISDIKETYVQK